MELLKINRKTENKAEQLKLIISIYCVIMDIKLSDTEITILSYFINYGINESTKKLIFKSELLKNDNSYKNLLSKLKSKGFIKKDEIKREYYVNKEKFGNTTDDVIGILIKMDNT